MSALISPEYGIVLDTEYKIVGEAKVDVALVNIGPLIKKVEYVELLAKELLTSLDPTTAPLISTRPRRECVLKYGGLYGNMVLGFVIGCFVFAIAVLFYVAESNPTLFKTLFGG